MFLLQALKGKNDFWRYVMVITMVVIAYVIGQVPLAIASVAAISKNGLDDQAVAELQSTLNFAELGLHPNLVFVLLLSMFICAMAALYIGIVRIHKRDFLTIWTGRRSFDLGRCLWAFLIWIGFSLVFELMGMISDPDNYVLQFQPWSFIVLLIIVILILPIQTSFEEVFIRGYLMQGLAIISKTPWLPLLGSSLVFGAMHMMNPEVQAFGISTMLTYYVSIALFLGILAVIDNGLELAIGVHTATNAYGALFVTFDSSAIKTPAIYRLIEVSPGMMTIYSFIALSAFLLLAHKRYDLDWSKLTEPIYSTKIYDSFKAQLQSFFNAIGGVKEVQNETTFRTWKDPWSRSSMLTEGLIAPRRLLSPTPSANFELSIPQTFPSVEGETAPTSAEVMERLVAHSDEEMLRDNDRVRMALSNGETIYLGLHRQPMSEIMKDWDLEWDLDVIHVVQMSRSLFEDDSTHPAQLLNEV